MLSGPTMGKLLTPEPAALVARPRTVAVAVKWNASRRPMLLMLRLRDNTVEKEALLVRGFAVAVCDRKERRERGMAARPDTADKPRRISIDI